MPAISFVDSLVLADDERLRSASVAASSSRSTTQSVAMPQSGGCSYRPPRRVPRSGAASGPARPFDVVGRGARRDHRRTSVEQPAVVVATKTGFVFVLERDTGHRLW